MQKLLQTSKNSSFFRIDKDRGELANITDLDTVLGEFSFNADGDAVYDPIVLIVENGELKVFELSSVFDVHNRHLSSAPRG